VREETKGGETEVAGSVPILAVPILVPAGAADPRLESWSVRAAAMRESGKRGKRERHHPSLRFSPPRILIFRRVQPFRFRVGQSVGKRKGLPPLEGPSANDPPLADCPSRARTEAWKSLPKKKGGRALTASPLSL